MPRLGCSNLSAYLSDKCHGSKLCDLPNATEIFFSRVLDEVSEAQVTVAVGGSIDDPCCACLATVEPWCHNLVIVREGDGIVWVGPVQQVIYSLDQVLIKANDKLAWLQVRVNEVSIVNTDPTVPLTDTATEIIFAAMADDGDSPCFLDCIFNNGDGLGASHIARERAFHPFIHGPTAFDDFQSIADSGMDYTVVRDCLILGSEDLPASPITTLNDEHILGDLEIIKDGKLQGNRFFVRYEGDDDPVTCQANCGGCPACVEPVVNPCFVTPCPGEAEGAQECYGAIERVISDVNGIPNVDVANATAQKYVDAGRLTPRFIEFPPGTRLSPETPWALPDMIPGQRVDVVLSRYCIPINQSFRLLKVQVTDNFEGEEIGIDLGTINVISS